MATITPGTTPIPYTYGGHTYWLMPNGKWANSKDGSGNVPQSAIAAIMAGQGTQQNGYGGTGTEKPPTGSTGGTGTGGTGTGTGGGAVPIPAPTPIMAPALNYSGRFGTYYDPAYQVGTSYAGPETVPGIPTPTATPPGAPAGTGSVAGAPQAPPATPGAPTPSPLPSGVPGAPNTQFPTNPAAGGAPRPGGGLLSSGGGGNDRGGGLLASGQGGYSAAAGGRDGFTGNAGGTGGGGGYLGTSGQAPGFQPDDYINIGWPGQVALGIASKLPGVWGLPATVANLGMHAYNTAGTNAINEGMGLGGLDLGQWAGGILGLNRYGSFSDPLIASKETVQAKYPGLSAGVSPAGYYDPGFFARLFGDQPATEYTPTEFAQRRYAQVHAPEIIGGIGRAPVPTDAVDYSGMARTGNGVGTGGGNTAAGNGYSNSGNAAKADGTAAGGRSTDAGGGYSADGGNYKGFRRGGFIPGKPDAIPDNRPVNADEGEFVVKRSAAKAAGKGLLRSLNTAAGARKMRGLLRSA